MRFYRLSAEIEMEIGLSQRHLSLGSVDVRGHHGVMQVSKKIYTLRRAQAADVDPIHEIEQISFTSPWSKQLIRQAVESSDGSNYFLVAVSSDDTILGYICYSLVADEVHILTLATDPQYRRQGIAHSLIMDSIEKGRVYGAVRADLEVRESNESAIRLYQGLGFALVGRRPRYYSNPTEDALLLSLDLNSTTNSDDVDRS